MKKVEKVEKVGIVGHHHVGKSTQGFTGLEPIVITNPYKESMINPWKIKLTRKERRALERKNKR